MSKKLLLLFVVLTVCSCLVAVEALLPAEVLALQQSVVARGGGVDCVNQVRCQQIDDVWKLVAPKIDASTKVFDPKVGSFVEYETLYRELEVVEGTALGESTSSLGTGISSAGVFANCDLTSYTETEARGKYTGGSLDKGVALSKKKYLNPRRSQNEHFGTIEMVNTLEAAACHVYNTVGKAKMVVHDLSLKDGGDIRGHTSHENGLDVDLGFYYFEKNTLTNRFVAPCRTETITKTFTDETGKQRTVTTKKCVAGTLVSTFTDSRALEANWQFLRAAAKVYDLSLVFVDSIIITALKDHVERTGQKAEWDRLGFNRFMNEEEGHHNHYHMRLKCPKNDVTCRDNRGNEHFSSKDIADLHRGKVAIGGSAGGGVVVSGRAAAGQSSFSAGSCSSSGHEVISEGASQDVLGIWTKATENLNGRSWMGKLSENSDRDVIVIVPCATDLKKEFEMVYFFHGHDGFSEDDMGPRVVSQLSEMSDRNVVLVYPRFAWSKSIRDRSVGESASLRRSPLDLVGLHARVSEILGEKFLKEAIQVVPSRIVVVGHSAGGAVIKQTAQNGGLLGIGVDEIRLSDSDYYSAAKGVWDSFLESSPSVSLFMLVQDPSRKDAHAPTANAIDFMREKMGMNGWSHKLCKDWKNACGGPDKFTTPGQFTSLDFEGKPALTFRRENVHYTPIKASHKEIGKRSIMWESVS